MSRRPREQVDYLHLEELGGLEMLKASYFQQEFSRHVHEGFCIGVIEEGAQRFYRTGGNHVAPQGDIILVNADEVTYRLICRRNRLALPSDLSDS